MDALAKWEEIASRTISAAMRHAVQAAANCSFVGEN
jgi:hypothetical protein